MEGGPDAVYRQTRNRRLNATRQASPNFILSKDLVPEKINQSPPTLSCFHQLGNEIGFGYGKHRHLILNVMGKPIIQIPA